MNIYFTTHTRKRTSGRLLWMLLLTSLPFLKVNGQQEISLDVPRIVPVSPTATAMEKYQSYPVDYCTGVPNITIPLYEIVAGEVTIPVTLSYHASGLKPKERSGYAGTGWTLNLEPSISRQVNGVADDDTYGWFNRQYSWNTRPIGERELFYYYEDRVNNQCDTQPDKFTYKLPQGGGSGYFNQSYYPLWTVPRNNDRVEYHNASGMEITDENGIRYSFNGACEKTGDYVTRWLCSSIWSARNPGQELVNFSYRTIPHLTHPNKFYNLDNKLIFDAKQASGDRRVIMFEQNKGIYYRLQPNLNNGTQEAIREITTAEEAGISYGPSFSHFPGDISITQLLDVHFKGNKLSVSYKSVGTTPNNSEVFNEIEVTDENGTMVRNIKFFITPYNGYTSLTRLDSIRISAPGVENRVYAFRYHGTISVPSIYTTAVDHWGFCNGSEAGETKSLPDIHETVMLDINGFNNMKPFTVNHKGASREPDAECIQTGVLSMITDPQGLQTSFYYEGNMGAFRDNSKEKEYRDYLHPVGGLRIEHIETYDPHTRKRIRKYYKYGLTKTWDPNYEPIWGGGAIKHIVTQRDYFSSVTLVSQDPYTSSIWNENLTFYNSMPISNITFNNGSSVMYNVVSEVIEGADAYQKTMYYYNVKMHDFEDLLTWDDNDPSASVKEFVTSSITDANKTLVRKKPYLSHEQSDDFNLGASNQKYGKLLRTEYFRNKELMATKEYVYTEKDFWNWEQEIEIPERQLIIDVNMYMQHHTVVEGPAFTTYRYIIDWSTYSLLDKEITKRYHTVNGRRDVFTTEKKYSYEFDFVDPGFSLRPRCVETTGSDGTQATDNFDYLANYPGILSYHKHTEGTDSRESRILFKSESCLPEKVQSRTNQMTDYRDEVVYRQYDGYDNPVEIAGKDGIPVSFIWSYRNRFPIARIENASIQEVYSAIGVSDLDDCAASEVPSTLIWGHINSLRDKLPNASVTTYQYVPLKGMVSVTDPNRIVTKFEYDNYYRLTDGYYLDPDSRKVMLQKYIYNFGK